MENRWKMINEKWKIQRGFTLIELLVVISIIGILATLVMANLNSARSRARDAQRKSDIKSTATALRLYFNDNSIFPATGSLTWGSPFTGAGGIVYMNTLPKDPLSTQSYFYKRDPLYSDKFTLSACLENQSDPQGVDGTISNSNCSGKKIFLIQP